MTPPCPFSFSADLTGPSCEFSSGCPFGTGREAGVTTHPAFMSAPDEHDQNARLTPVRREEIARAVLSGRVSKAQAAREFGVSAMIVTRSTARFQAAGRAGIQDRASRPKRIPTQSAEALAERIIRHRRQRLCGRHIAGLPGVNPDTLSRVLRRAGLSWLKDRAPPEPVVHSAYREPGGPIDLDIRKIGRFERVGHRITPSRRLQAIACRATDDRTVQSNSRGVGSVEPLSATGSPGDTQHKQRLACLGSPSI